VTDVDRDILWLIMEIATRVVTVDLLSIRSLRKTIRLTGLEDSIISCVIELLYVSFLVIDRKSCIPAETDKSAVTTKTTFLINPYFAVYSNAGRNMSQI